MATIKKPEWIRVKAVDEEILNKMKSLLDSLNLHTICESAICPNIGTCFCKGTATFMILGNICTRNCKFCGVEAGSPLPPDPDEPRRVAEAAKRLGLKHVVVTSVTRDDLEDGGASYFASTVREIKNVLPSSSTDLLIPDFKGSIEALKTVINSSPDIIAHNVETVPRLYPTVRPMANYKQSLKVLRNVKELAPHIYTKSGLMLGLGEKREEVLEVLRDLKEVGCDFVTIGQYLRPTPRHLEVKEFIRPEVFDEYKKIGKEMGFLYVASGPFVRSSFHAEEALEYVRKRNSK